MKKARSFFAVAALALPLLGVGACGKDGENRTGSIRYHLEQAASGVLSNALILDVEGEFKPSFSLSGSGFTAAVPLDTITSFQGRTALVGETFGEVSVQLTLYQENGKPYLTDTLPWKTSGEVPPVPKAYFSELASADAYVYLVVPANRGENTKEIHVEGDLPTGAGAGKYYTIPSDDQILLELSPGDGLKTIRVKYRNIFGVHSETVNMSIVRKSQGPIGCKALTVASKTATGSIRTRIQATNEGPLFYKVTGDVAIERDYVQFTDAIEDSIALRGAEGSKHLAVKIKDEAGNACDDINLTVAYDRSYVPGGISIAGNPLWTDDPAVTILPHYDQLEGDALEMYVGGGVAPGPHTFRWIPYQANLAIVLSPTSGTRHVIMQFRKEQTVMLEAATSVFLRPYVLLSGVAPSLMLLPGNILGASSLTITGCAEVYAQVAYQEQFPCTPSAMQATVVYSLQDGTTVSRSVSF